jgi:hypothetical protein
MVRRNDSFGARKRQPRGCDIHPSRGGHQGLVTSTNRRLPTPAYPRKSGQNLSQGPIIHRPHLHRGAGSISDFGQSFTPSGARVAKATSQAGIVNRPFSHRYMTWQVGGRIVKRGAFIRRAQYSSLRAKRSQAFQRASDATSRPPRGRPRSKARLVLSSKRRTIGAGRPAQLSEAPGK